MASKFELQAYGMSEESINKLFLENTLTEVEMVIAGLLSDCQELLPQDEDGKMTNTDDMIRKNLNIAKFILFKKLREAREVA